MSTNNVSFNIRMDRNLKNELDIICNELGMSISTAIWYTVGTVDM